MDSVGKSLWRYSYGEVTEYRVEKETPKTLTIRVADDRRYVSLLIKKIEIGSTYFWSIEDLNAMRLARLNAAVEAAQAKVDGFGAWAAEQFQE